MLGAEPRLRRQGQHACARGQSPQHPAGVPEIGVEDPFAEAGEPVADLPGDLVENVGRPRRTGRPARTRRPARPAASCRCPTTPSARLDASAKRQPSAAGRCGHPDLAEGEGQVAVERRVGLGGGAGPAQVGQASAAGSPASPGTSSAARRRDSALASVAASGRLIDGVEEPAGVQPAAHDDRLPGGNSPRRTSSVAQPTSLSACATDSSSRARTYSNRLSSQRASRAPGPRLHGGPVRWRPASRNSPRACSSSAKRRDRRPARRRNVGGRQPVAQRGPGGRDQTGRPELQCSSVFRRHAASTAARERCGRVGPEVLPAIRCSSTSSGRPPASAACPASRWRRARAARVTATSRSRGSRRRGQLGGIGAAAPASRPGRAAVRSSGAGRSIHVDELAGVVLGQQGSKVERISPDVIGEAIARAASTSRAISATRALASAVPARRA